MSASDDRFARLRAPAEKATPGPWKDDPNGEARNVRGPDGGIVAQMGHLRGPHGSGGRRPSSEVAANAQLIAACSPDVIITLLDAADERDRLRALLDLYNLGGWTDAERLMVERDRLAALARYGLAVFDAHREECGDLDGGWLQEQATDLGLLAEVTVTEPCCAEMCRCAEYYGEDEWPVKCLRSTTILVDARAALAGMEKL